MYSVQESGHTLVRSMLCTNPALLLRYKHVMIIPSRNSIALLCLKHRIAELPLRAGLIHAL